MKLKEPNTSLQDLALLKSILLKRSKKIILKHFKKQTYQYIGALMLSRKSIDLFLTSFDDISKNDRKIYKKFVKKELYKIELNNNKGAYLHCDYLILKTNLNNLKNNLRNE
jgi:hypothetical protein